MKSKRGVGLGVIAAVLVVIVVGGIILGIQFDPIKKGATYILKPLLKPLGFLDEDEEEKEKVIRINPTCNDICGFGNCIVGIENGNSGKDCDDSFNFDNNNDYCFCGEEKDIEIVTPVQDDIDDKTCDNICTDNDYDSCQNAVNNYGIKGCSDKFTFDNSDDYCFCGGTTNREIPVPTNFDSNCGVQCIQESPTKCITGIEDDNNIKKCDNSDRFGFEENNDYCICGDTASVKEFPDPVPSSKKSCADICRDNLELGCVMGIDDFGGNIDGGTKQKCRNPFGFESNPRDEYCICGDTKIVEGPLNVERSCSDTCGDLECIIGVDDGGYKKCDQGIRVEKINDDDYCICGGTKYIPVPDDIDDKTCTNICDEKEKSCVTAVHDNKDVGGCDSKFTFNNNDDYCTCGDAVIVTPSRSDIRDTCNRQCGSDRCIIGIDDGEDYRLCNDPFDFEKAENYCICSDDFEKKIPTLS